MPTVLITSGGGPMECRLAVAHVRSRMQLEAENLDVSFSISDDGDAPPSVIVLVEGEGAMVLVQAWVGTILWRQESALRPHHRRANWFVGVFLLPDLAPDSAQVPLAEVVFTGFRAGGPGGQHQNTTDSAVRASWRGLAAISRDERSQHRNKAKAHERLQHLVHAAQTERQRAAAGGVHRQHRAIARGDPVRSFTGPDFLE